MAQQTERHLRALELDKILNRLAESTASPAAADAARALRPAKGLDSVRLLLDETWDAYRLTAKFGAPSFSGLADVSNPLRRAEAGGALNMAELLRIGGVLRTLRGSVAWREQRAGG